MSLGDSLTDDAYELLQDLSNKALARHPRLELMTLWEVYQRLHSDQSFRKAVKERRAQIAAILDGCHAGEARLLYDAINNLFDEAFFINSFGWAIYIVPPIAVFLLIRKVKGLVAHALIASDGLFDSMAGPADAPTAMREPLRQHGLAVVEPLRRRTLGAMSGPS